MDIKDFASMEKARLTKENAEIRKFISRLPEGEIRFHKNGGHTRWRCYACDEETGTGTFTTLYKTKEDYVKKAAALTLKHSLLKTMKTNEECLQQINQILETYPDIEGISKRNPDMSGDVHMLLDWFLAPAREYCENWASEKYEKSREHPEALTKKSKNKIMMRSKSEVLIADMLLDRKIPFRYEQALHCGSAVYYPDFTILNPLTLEDIIIWEHFGTMEKQSYLHNNMDKFEMYCRQGYIYGKNLIVTFETLEHPLTAETVEMKIEEMFGKLSVWDRLQAALNVWNVSKKGKASPPAIVQSKRTKKTKPTKPRSKKASTLL